MAIEDVTRNGFVPAKGYAGLRLQQGRVLTDDDVNQVGALGEEAQRQAMLDIVGAAGSPDDGFRIGAPAIVGGRVDFTLDAGVMHLGGQRLELSAPAQFLMQSDYLQNPGVPAPDAARTDLAWLECWLQPVSAVEDSELLDIALGGPDTATRIKPMARVHLVPGVDAADCAAGRIALEDAIAQAGLGVLGQDSEIRPDTTLTIGFDQGGDAGDLCRPAILGGYLGAENQAIRVQMAGAAGFTWGFDNGSRLYRATLSADRATVTLLSEPPDEALWPAAGQIAEIIPWGAVLANGEKLAEEVTPGHFSRISVAYDPDRRTFGLTAPPTAGFGLAWEGRADVAALRRTRYGLLAEEPIHFFVRIWDRGADLASSPLLPFAGATPLGQTGLTARFGGMDRQAAGHWTIAARPNAPDRVSPWELLVGRAPHGFRRFAVPLGLIRWQGGAGRVQDCRPRFRPLTRLGGCCTVSVGDGRTSHGDFTTIQAAIDSLPDAGGEVCLLPGIHVGRFAIAGRSGVSLHGCGPRSRIVAPDEGAAPVVRIAKSRDIAIRDVAIEATDVLAIRADAVQGLILRGIAFRSGGQGSVAGEVRGLVLAECEVTLVSRAAGGIRAAFALRVTGGQIEDNRIRAERARLAPGGIQIAGGSERVRIRGNRIEGGAGNGITLGSIRSLPARRLTNVAALREHYAKAERDVLVGQFTVDENGCLRFDPAPTPDPDPDDPRVPMLPVSDGDLDDIAILDNIITGQGGNGIAVARFLPLTGAAAGIITVRRLLVADNRISGNLAGEVQPTAAGLAAISAIGGIALAGTSDAIFARNVIEANGARAALPACGLFVLVAEAMEATGNRIHGNGRGLAPEDGRGVGRRGGLVIGAARPLAGEPRDAKAGATPTDGRPALSVSGNSIVAPEGRAIEALAIGTVSVSDNTLVSQGAAALDRAIPPRDVAEGKDTAGATGSLFDLLGGAAVGLFNLGVSNELYRGQAGFAGVLLDTIVPGEVADGRPRLAAGGNLMFHGNRVGLDLLAPARSLVPSAVVLGSLDDVACADNQFDCDLGALRDIVLVNLMALGFSVRVTDNRFKEGLLSALVSVSSYGIFNRTAGNQATHCILAAGFAPLLENGPNSVMWEALLGDAACSGIGAIAAAIAQRYYATNKG